MPGKARFSYGITSIGLVEVRRQIGTCSLNFMMRLGTVKQTSCNGSPANGNYVNISPVTDTFLCKYTNALALSKWYNFSLAIPTLPRIGIKGKKGEKDPYGKNK